MKIRFNLRGGILTLGPRIIIFSGSCRSFLFDSFGHDMEIKKNPCDGGFPKRPKKYIQSLKLAFYNRLKMEVSFNLRVGISTQRPKTVILNNSYGTFIIDSCGHGLIIRINPRDGGFPIRTKLYIPSLKLNGFARSGVKITFNLRGGISTKVPKIAISSS